MARCTRPWTADEVAQLRRMVNSGQAALGIAPKLRRPVGSVQLKIIRLGIAHVALRVRRTRKLARVAALVAAGKSDLAISRVMGGVSVLSVRWWRRTLKLPANHDPSAVGRRALRNQLARDGARSFSDLRWRASRVRAVAEGWPAGCNHYHARYLEVLDRLGPLTRDQLCLAIGTRPNHGSRPFWTLRRAGWIVVARPHRTGAGGRPALFDLAPGVRLARRTALNYHRRDRDYFRGDCS
jgi:hypothetical protein